MTTTQSPQQRESRVPAQLGRAPRKAPRYLPVLISLVVLIGLSAVIAPRTLGPISLGAMLPFAAILAVAAVGQTLVVQQRGIDLSVGGVISFAAVLVAIGPDRHHIPVWFMVVITVLICAVIGVVNSMLVSRLLITPLVATLAMNAVLMGAVLLYTRGSASAVPQELSATLTTKFLGAPLLAWASAIIIAILAFLAAKTVAGRRLVLTGSNPSTAVTNGIGVERNLVLAYVTATVCYGIAGIFLASYLENVTVNVGGSYLMSVIAVVIVGGTPLTGGRGTIVGTAIAALFMSQLIQVVLTLGAPTATQMLIQAIAISVAAILSAVRPGDRLRRRRANPA